MAEHIRSGGVWTYVVGLGKVGVSNQDTKLVWKRSRPLCASQLEVQQYVLNSLRSTAWVHSFIPVRNDLSNARLFTQPIQQAANDEAELLRIMINYQCVVLSVHSRLDGEMIGWFKMYKNEK